MTNVCTAELVAQWNGEPSGEGTRSFHWLMSNETSAPVVALWLPALQLWLINGANVAVSKKEVAGAYTYMAMVAKATKIEELAQTIFKGVLRA